MLMYADPDELPEAASREDAVSLIVVASHWVTEHVATYRHATDENDMPLDADILADFKAATLTQCNAWLKAGIDPGQITTDRVVSSKSLGPRSEAYADAATVTEQVKELRAGLNATARAILSRYHGRIYVF